VNVEETRTRCVDTLIVGGGFSSIPLLRELERENREFIIVSEGKSIWADLEQHQRLDFDLVSSLYTSVYSFELVEMAKSQKLGDRYQAAKEFYDVHKKYATHYEDKTIRAKVDRIDNYPDYSLVHLADGRTYQATYIVLATSFNRKIHESLQEFPFTGSLKGKTVVLTSIGDSANLLISKLLCHDANVKLVANGFVALDKMVVHQGILREEPTTITVDQLEYHNVAKLLPFLYKRTITGAYLLSYLLPGLARVLYRPSLAVSHPLTFRRASADCLFQDWCKPRPFRRKKVAFLNGMIAIKYWPIDTYYLKFADDVEHAIQQGFLLNDLPFFIDQGLVECWDKETTEIRHDKQEIVCDGRTCRYDYLIEGDREEPALPAIYINGEPHHPFQYSYRDHYMGVIPKALHNLFLLGYTRPTTGGLCNIIEMQCLLIHRLITGSTFRKDILSTLPDRITTYNRSHYVSEESTPADHLVYYGFYTDEVAQILNIQKRLRDCRRPYDVLKYLVFPNNGFLYRESGPYRVEGVDKIVTQILRDHDHYASVVIYLCQYVLMEFCALATLLMLPLPFWVGGLLALVHLYLPMTTFLNDKLGFPVAGKSHRVYRSGIALMLLICPIALVFIQSIWIPAVTWIGLYLWVYVGCWMGWNRSIFCDMASKRQTEYVEFFSQYRAAFKRVKTAERRRKTNNQ